MKLPTSLCLLAGIGLMTSLSGNPLTDPNDFPITVWLQSTSKAEQYSAAGFNGYTGLVQNGDLSDELAVLQKNGLYLITDENAATLADDSGVIMAWMHGDEPDNAQSIPNGEGYGPPITPEVIIADYKEIKAKDSSRPVILNLSQGVAWDGWFGRGVRTNHPEDYAEYAKGADIVSFDIYPVTHSKEEIAGKLEWVAFGIDRLKEWAPGKPIWTCIECTHISNPDIKPTPDQVRALVWIALIHGADGLIYFSHQFNPRFIEAGLLADPEMTSAVTVINKRIRALASVLKSPDRPELVSVSFPNAEAPVDSLVKQQDGAIYIFSANMRGVDNSAVFKIKGATKAKVEVLDEDRTLAVVNGEFRDDFAPYGVHLYRVTP